MSSLRLLMSVLVSAAMLAACAAESEPPAAMATAEVNPVTGEGLPNPNPRRIGSWATLPEGREWGSTAGLDIDPTDGHVWGYERCGSGSAGGPGVNCDNNPVDPIFKFDRNTGEVLANFGAGVFVTPHAAASSEPTALAPVITRQIAAHERGEGLDNLVDRSAGY